METKTAVSKSPSEEPVDHLFFAEKILAAVQETGDASQAINILHRLSMKARDILSVCTMAKELLHREHLSSTDVEALEASLKTMKMRRLEKQRRMNEEMGVQAQKIEFATCSTRIDVLGKAILEHVRQLARGDRLRSLVEQTVVQLHQVFPSSLCMAHIRGRVGEVVLFSIVQDFLEASTAHDMRIMRKPESVKFYSGYSLVPTPNTNYFLRENNAEEHCPVSEFDLVMLDQRQGDIILLDATVGQKSAWKMGNLMSMMSANKGDQGDIGILPESGTPVSAVHALIVKYSPCDIALSNSNIDGLRIARLILGIRLQIDQLAADLMRCSSLRGTPSPG